MEARNAHDDAVNVLETHFQNLEAGDGDDTGISDSGNVAGDVNSGEARGADSGEVGGDADPGPDAALADGDDAIGVRRGVDAEDESAIPGESGADDGAVPGDDSGTPNELELNALAEKLGLKMKDLYAVEIPLGQDNGSTTLGELKDRYNDVLNVDKAKESLQTARTEQQNEILVARQELQQVVSMLGDSISPEMLQHARQQHQSMISREAEQLLEVLPQWRNTDVFQADRLRINEFLGQYGFSPSELSTVYDHRLLKLAFDASGMQKRITKAHSHVQKVTKAPTAPGKAINQNRSKAQKKANILKTAKGGNRDQQLAGIHALLGG